VANRWQGEFYGVDISSKMIERAQAIDMLRNDHESTPVSRARALAYCCSGDARLIEMATISELQQPQQSEEQEVELDAEYNAAQSELLDQDSRTHDDYLQCLVVRSGSYTTETPNQKRRCKLPPASS
jgi:hypothetical protein